MSIEASERSIEASNWSIEASTESILYIMWLRVSFGKMMDSTVAMNSLILSCLLILELHIFFIWWQAAHALVFLTANSCSGL